MTATSGMNSGQRSLIAEREFRARLEALSATLLEPYKGTTKPHRVRCAAGHECGPYPSYVNHGGGICRVCAGRDPATAEREFRARLEALGATLLEPSWLGANKPHRVRCAAGHECSPRPTHVQQGEGICRVCAGRDPATAEREFRARLEALGATLLEPYKGTTKPHRVRCAAGHECSPRPGHVQQGEGICRACAGHDPATAEREFRARLEALGATLLEPSWLGVGKPHRVRCAAGHECGPYPLNVARGGGICRICAGLDPATAEREFRARLEALGATLLEPSWLGVGKPHRVRCAAGHECSPRPTHVKDGVGICAKCAGKEWNVFYVTADPAGNIKLGITSIDPRPRLADHKRAGFRKIVRLYVNLPDGVAQELERRSLSALALARIQPIRGREYFPPAALPIVLSITERTETAA